jgi:NTP pyrophosphatase (non-canonical NTP hydrolase)
MLKPTTKRILLKQKFNYMQFEPELLVKAHGIARSKGFWNTPSPDVRKINLIREELGELTTAHRKNKIKGGVVSEEFFREDYENNVKGTVEEELSDVCIRIFDLVGSEREMIDLWPVLNKEFTSGDFDTELDRAYTLTCDVLRENVEIRRFVRIPTALHGVVCCMLNLAEMFEIDLRQAIEMKMRFNEGREYLHGKTY